MGPMGPYWLYWAILGSIGHTGPYWLYWAILGYTGPYSMGMGLWALLYGYGPLGPTLWRPGPYSMAAWALTLPLMPARP